MHAQTKNTTISHKQRIQLHIQEHGIQQHMHKHRKQQRNNKHRIQQWINKHIIHPMVRQNIQWIQILQGGHQIHKHNTNHINVSSA